MGVRITTNMLAREALADVNRARQRLAVTQQRLSSGLRINRPADDPVGVRAATLLKQSLAANEQFQRNIDQTRPRIAASESAIANAGNVFLRAKELAIAGANGTQDAQSRQAIAGEVEALHGSLLAEANARLGGSYVFAGRLGDLTPFTVTAPFDPSGPTAATVVFAADAGEIQIDIDEGVSVRATLNGERVFLGDGDSDGSPDAGLVDLFETLGDLWVALQNDDRAAIAATLPDLDAAIAQLSTERTRIGTVQTQLEDFDTKLAERDVRLTQQLSDVQDADAAEVISDLLLQENALRVALEGMARLVQPSLLDFLA